MKSSVNCLAALGCFERVDPPVRIQGDDAELFVRIATQDVEAHAEMAEVEAVGDVVVVQRCRHVVRALDERKPIECDVDVSGALDLVGYESSIAGVGSRDVNPLDGVDGETEHRLGDRAMGDVVKPNRHLLTGVASPDRFVILVEQLDLRDSTLTRSPPTAGLHLDAVLVRCPGVHVDHLARISDRPELAVAQPRGAIADVPYLYRVHG